MKRLPITNYEGFYDITDTGEVFSVQREVLGQDGTVYPFKAQKKKLCVNAQTGYLMVNLWKHNERKDFYVHRLVAEAFIPNPHNKPEVNHKNGNRQNNRVHNLEWVTRSENAQHAVITKLRVYTNRLTKEEFIQCLQDVINGESYASLSKRVPYRVPFLSTKLRKIAKELGVEHLLDGSLYEQQVARARINGNPNK